MTGTMSGFNTALTALRYQRNAMDVASNNIANVNTEGYVRRRTESQSVGAPIVPALWSRYDGMGDGVTSGNPTRMSDALLDARSRDEHGRQTYLDTRSAVLGRVETGFGEPGENGVAAALDDFRSSWGDLESNPELSSTRKLVLDKGQALADALRAQSGNVANEGVTQRGTLIDAVDEANSVAHDLAQINRSISAAAVSQLDDSDLRDQRDVLAQRLSELTGGVTTARPDGSMDVSVGGKPVVSGQDSFAISIAAGVSADGSADGAPLSLAVGGAPVATAALGGKIGATGELLSTTLPGLKAQIDAVAKELADSVNAVHTTGYDQSGAPAQAFFAYDASDPAASLRVALTDPGQVAASDQPGGGNGTGIAERLGEPGGVESSYRGLVAGFGSDVVSSRRLATTQRLLTSQVDGSREQLSGVSLDEETVNLVQAQHAYEAAARVMTTMDQVLDTLINQMAR